MPEQAMMRFPECLHSNLIRLNRPSGHSGRTRSCLPETTGNPEKRLGSRDKRVRVMPLRDMRRVSQVLSTSLNQIRTPMQRQIREPIVRRSFAREKQCWESYRTTTNEVNSSRHLHLCTTPKLKRNKLSEHSSKQGQLYGRSKREGNSSGPVKLTPHSH